MTIALAILSFGISVCADTTSGPFTDLQVMEERAAHDQNQRAVAVIRYVRETPSGKRFMVDTQSKVIEVEILLADEKRMAKSLERRSDQRLLVEYHRRVKVYADAYSNAVEKVRIGSIKEAGRDFDALAEKFPEHASALRGKAAVSFVSGQEDRARLAAEKATAKNPNDPVARALWGFALLKTGNVRASMNERAIVQNIDPKREYVNSWEVDLLKSKNAELFHTWSGPE